MNSRLNVKGRITPSRTTTLPEKTLLPPIDNKVDKLDKLATKISNSIDLMNEKLEVVMSRLDDLERYTGLKEK